MGEALVDVRDLLTDGAPAWRRAAATTLVRNDQRDALIGGSREQSSLAISGMSHDSNALSIDFGIGDQIINRPVDTPGPCGDGAPVNGLFRLPGDAVFPSSDATFVVDAVFIDVSVANVCDRVAARNRPLKLPPSCKRATTFTATEVPARSLRNAHIIGQ